jgi:hypothetical protein
VYYKWNVSDGEGTYIDRFQEDRAVNPRWGLSKRGLVGGGVLRTAACCRCRARALLALLHNASISA